MRKARVLGAGLLTLAATGALVTGTSTAASAADTCPYPYVCIMINGTIKGQFKEVTTGYQDLPSRPTGTSSSPVVVVNTRNDDTATIHFTSGSTTCIAPNKSFSVTGGTLDGIRISSSSTC
ncbi:hypothetical protein ACIQGZ_12670 [Streptomyces sp. NPDC092296]|uniref:hypothetical protein n=1 Tax=Streptomyces sp. NPDC092296 TaxID=3366012 RepID=UPI0037F2E569